MRIFERILWSARFLMIIPIIASLLASVATLLVGVVTLLHAVPILIGALRTASRDTATLERELLATTIKSVDTFLFSAFLIIFSLGLYELFIQRITVTTDSEVASSLLIIRSLDDLKDRLIKIVVLLLVVEFLQEALSLLYHTPQELLYLAGSILLVGFAVFLSNRTGHGAELRTSTSGPTEEGSPTTQETSSD
ncbi:MAG: YqhA family protein [Chloroflexi bacterium]|nr:YqhA family protein [Chloroflexota bacterium]